MRGIVKAIIVSILVAITGTGAIISDALFKTGDMAINTICKNNENIPNEQWRQRGDEQCKSINELLQLIRGFTKFA